MSHGGSWGLWDERGVGWSGSFGDSEGLGCVCEKGEKKGRDFLRGGWEDKTRKGLRYSRRSSLVFVPKVVMWWDSAFKASV